MRRERRGTRLAHRAMSGRPRPREPWTTCPAYAEWSLPDPTPARACRGARPVLREYLDYGRAVLAVAPDDDEAPADQLRLLTTDAAAGPAPAASGRARRGPLHVGRVRPPTPRRPSIARQFALNHCAMGTQTLLIASTCRWLVPQHPPSTAKCGWARAQVAVVPASSSGSPASRSSARSSCA